MLTLSGRVLLVGSCLVGLAAVLWPTGNQHRENGTVSSVLTSSCPLGYTSGQRPLQHPPVGLNEATDAKAGTRINLPDERYHLFFNATIWTGQEQPEGVAFAQAMLVHRGGIAAVGSLKEVRRAADEAVQGRHHSLPDNGVEPAAAVIAPGGTGRGDVVEHDLGGRFVVPGFIDAHVHVVSGGLSLGRVDLRGAASREEFRSRVASVASRMGPSEWLLGGQWDEGEWGGQLPTTDWLDEVCGGRPAYLTRHDLHLALANTAALKLAGIGPDTPDPVGGIIDRDPATGMPTGLLRERAMTLIDAVMPEPSPAERRAALAAANRLALTRGVTTLVDMGRYLSDDQEAPWRDLEEVYLSAADAGELTVRIFTHVPLRTWRRLSAWVAARGRAHPGGKLFWGALKEFADGSLGSHTALMWGAYSDVEPGSEGEGKAGGGQRFGQRAMGLQELRELSEAAVKAGLQVSVHAIGDRAVDDVLGAYTTALEAAIASGSEAASPGEQSGGVMPARVRQLGEQLRLRIEHTQHLSGALNTTRALAAAGVTAVPNPLHLLTDAAMLLPRLGPDRASRAFALASLVKGGLRPALASDWPVVDLQPLTGVYAAVHRYGPPHEVVCAMRRSLPSTAAGVARFEAIGASHDDASSCQIGTPAGPRAAEGSAGCAARGNCGEAGQGADDVAVRREPERGEEGCVAEADVAAWPVAFTPEERLSLTHALLGHTAWGARAAGLEDYVGSLSPGKRADFVELSTTLVEPLESGGTGSTGEGLVLSEGRLRRCLPGVLRTWIDGELAFDAEVGANRYRSREPANAAV